MFNIDSVEGLQALSVIELVDDGQFRNKLMWMFVDVDHVVAKLEQFLEV